MVIDVVKWTLYHAVIASAGHQINSNGGLYRPGHAHSLTKKAEVASVYRKQLNAGNSVSASTVAAEAKVRKSFANKVINELKSGDGLADPPKKERNMPIGKGSKTFDDEDVAALLQLRQLDPHRPLSSHQRERLQITGTYTDTSTICSWFLHGADNNHKGCLQSSSMAPINKHTPENAMRAHECVMQMIQKDMRRVET